ERMVWGILCASVVAKTKTTWAGGSSNVLSRALNAAVDSMWTSSMMYTRYRPYAGAVLTVSRISRTSSTLLLDAPSISITSNDIPAPISRQLAHARQGVGVGPFSQLRAFARIRAMVVLPTPRL